jgi:hypothetical protein
MEVQRTRVLQVTYTYTTVRKYGSTSVERKYLAYFEVEQSCSVRKLLPILAVRFDILRILKSPVRDPVKDTAYAALIPLSS